MVAFQYTAHPEHEDLTAECQVRRRWVAGEETSSPPLSSLVRHHLLEETEFCGIAGRQKDFNTSNSEIREREK